MSNTRKMNELEELGRVDAEKAYTKKGKRNLKAEKKRIVREVSSRGVAKRGHGKESKEEPKPVKVNHCSGHTRFRVNCPKCVDAVRA